MIKEIRIKSMEPEKLKGSDPGKFISYLTGIPGVDFGPWPSREVFEKLTPEMPEGLPKLGIMMIFGTGGEVTHNNGKTFEQLWD